ncbi:MAG: hypothetical protein JST54_03070 [Deltaproteobacteria bacterium]|nr:hypothetical protein [Deltaproteobacteria bacterium]
MSTWGSAVAISNAQTLGVNAAPSGRSSWLPFAGAIAMAVFVGLGLLGSYGIVLYRLRHSSAGRAALLQMHGSAQLKDMFGEPLKLHIEGGELQHEGEASFEMRVKGPKGSAMLDLDARAENHVWRVVKGTIVMPDNSEVPLEPVPLPEAKPAVPPVTPPANAPENPNQRGPEP